MNFTQIVETHYREQVTLRPREIDNFARLVRQDGSIYLPYDIVCKDGEVWQHHPLYADDTPFAEIGIDQFDIEFSHHGASGTALPKLLQQTRRSADEVLSRTTWYLRARFADDRGYFLVVLEPETSAGIPNVTFHEPGTIWHWEGLLRSNPQAYELAKLAYEKEHK